MDSQHKIKASIICFLMIFSLSGCGGGGGGSDTPSDTPANIAPVSNAGPDQTVTLSSPNTQIITLTGTSSDSDGNVVSHQWTQTEGAAVTLNGASTSSATFTVDAATQAYSFSYTVTDDGGAQQTDSTSVYVTEIIFSDSFADDSSWSYVDDTATGAAWSAAGELLQTSFLAFPSTAYIEPTSYHKGTYALLGDPAISGVSAYRFSVDITPLANNSGDQTEGNDVGIMFLRQSSLNYYRLSMNARNGFTRFEKITGGTFQTLAVNAIGYVENQPMTMAAEVNGDTIIVFIDGDPVFAVVDSAISSGTVALYCQDRAKFDNVLITGPTFQPLVAISSPLAYSVTPGNLVDLSVTAMVLNKPVGGSVAFSLDGGSEITVAGSGNIYSHVFPGVANGNHDVAAIVRNADGTEANSDINSMVGTGGDYYVTMGDSITNGLGDKDDSNNDSADGRMVAIQGYQARLADALTITTGLPQIVFNEGILGDTASDLNGRLDSILDRHPGANKVLMMIGTNDSNNGNNVDPDLFKTHVETIAGVIDDVNNKQVWLARTLPTYVIGTIPSSNPTLDVTRNARIEVYNEKIREIALFDTDDGIWLGPNFYTIFNSPTLYNDYLHPNDAGYEVMANGWDATLP